ncbi:glycosyl hydrolase family 2 [Dyadobacter beijingensis]|uniref:Glycosyl hydrolase family 2 n=1 Tax=Dyadobacter beijingensis TaxID=365489 RepID=A0ABQ2IIH2_9BACT|nr:glycosyl hydrolase [Dyadobacter beijingensis]GGN09826.1 glycosyl hydrolase family 2 [Dyadobacter beijingensis]
MRRLNLCFAFLLFQFVSAHAQSISTAKPWTYWWWMGSAVNKADITAQLEYFSKSGVGGVHIIPIYGVKGYEKQNISFLSPQWLEVMQHTIREGKRLGLGVDMTTGTGWPFGGPNVSPAMAAQSMTVTDGKPVVKPTGQKVKRPAPGGDGFVLDPFNATGMQQYLVRFDSAFARSPEKPRSMYNDSYEAYGANWTADFAEQFQSRRKYDLLEKLHLLNDSTGNPEATLVKIDYHQTLAELLLERYAKPWTDWSRQHGFLTRYQAHGSPGNLLDLYEAADIPETESFGTSRFSMPGLRIDPDYSIDQFGTPNPLAMKFASSAANLSGKKLVSSETGTWLANHFKVSLSQVKPQIDELFTAGINHIFYHGSTYSPEKEGFPGWLFYASTNFGKTAHFSEHFPLLNQYVEWCQKLLQDSKPDNDVLVYFPIHDLWATRAKSGGGVHLLEVHHVDRWLLDLPFGKLSERLWREGYAFDFVSDLQLKKFTVGSNGVLNSGNATYKTLVIPSATYLPEETLKELQRLANAGAKIVFDQKLPSKVTGNAGHEERQQAFDEAVKKVSSLQNVKVSMNLNADLAGNGVVREQLAEKGLTFIRKKSSGGMSLYFVANLGNTFQGGWVRIGNGKTMSRNTPMRGESLLHTRTVAGHEEIFLDLSPGESCFLESAADGSDIPFVSGVSKEWEIKGEWEVSFLNGKPSLPAPAKLTTLKSWTTLPDSVEYFSGKARYRITFDLKGPLKQYEDAGISLGDVREVASVKLNGKDLGTAWHIPFQVYAGHALKQKGNVLEIEVTNLSANYMRLRDQQQPDWKKFYDINIVDITYKKFDATRWQPMPSGLLGPVKLIY